MAGPGARARRRDEPPSSVRLVACSGAAGAQQQGRAGTELQVVVTCRGAPASSCSTGAAVVPSSATPLGAVTQGAAAPVQLPWLAQSHGVACCAAWRPCSAGCPVGFHAWCAHFDQGTVGDAELAGLHEAHAQVTVDHPGRVPAPQTSAGPWPGGRCRSAQCRFAAARLRPGRARRCRRCQHEATAGREAAAHAAQVRLPPLRRCRC